MADIKHAIVIAASEDRVRSLVTSAAGFAEWWAADASVNQDGTVELGFFDKSTIYRLRLEQASEHEILWRCESGEEWSGTLLQFTILGSESAATLRFAHKGWADETDYFTMCNTTWGTLMYRLKGAAEGKSPGPLFSISGLKA